MEIRPEQPDDLTAIRSLITAAFEHAEHSSGTEAAIVDALRAAGALTVSLVAVEDDDTMGHVAFSPVTIAGDADRWYGLGPVAVRPDRQGMGIGQDLIRAGLAALRRMGAKGCVVLGEPAYYGRFGFEADAALTLEGVPPDYFMSLAFEAPVPTGSVRYHPAFDAS